MVFITLAIIFNTLQSEVKFFESQEGRFSVIEPGKWEEKWQTIETDVGKMEVFTFYCEPKDSLGDPNVLYLINYMDYPEESFSNQEEDIYRALFQETLLSSEENLGGNIIYSENITYQSYPAKLSRIEYNEGEAVVKSKMIIAGQRFYYIQVFTTSHNSLNRKMDLFLDSFEILPSR